MKIEIYNESILIQSFNKVLSATLSDHLSGERTLEFSVITPRSQPISTGMIAKHEGQYYNIVRVARGMTNGIPVSSVSCEHISYVLNNEEYNLVTFVFEGTPSAGLAQLLMGTPFSVGVVEPVSTVEVAFTEGTLNRRNAVMRFIDACGGEIEYDGYRINIRSHRGSTTRRLLMDGENVTNVSAVLDSRELVAAYEISLFKMADLSAGDEVNITFTPLGINVDTRIIGISYNPFYRYTVRVEVGDYVPNLLASTSTQLDKIKQEFRAADGQMSSRIEDAEGNLSELSQTVDGFDLRIQSAEQNVATLSLTVGGFDVRITNAEGGVSQLSQTVSGFNTRISTAEGKISTISQNVSSITTRVSTAEGNISTVTQTANKVEWLIKSGTSASNFTLTDRTISLVANTIDLSGFVTFSNLSTSGQTTINGGNITTGSMSADRITTGTLDASKVTVTKLNASNITTGTLSADRINVSDIKISRLYIGTKVAIDSQSNTIYVGGDSSVNSFTYLYLKASQAINFSTWSSNYDGLTIDMSGKAVRPNQDNYFSLGTSAYSFKEMFAYAATIGDSYPIVINVSGSQRQLRPRTTNTSYPWYLGNSTNPFSYGYFTNLYAQVQAQLGTSTSAKVGFFGTTPVVRKTVANNATVATLITALKGYGLIV